MRNSRILRASAAAALLLLLTGCLKVDMSLDINQNDSVDGDVILAFSEELVELSGQDEQELTEQFRSEVMADAPQGVAEEPYREEGFLGTRLVLHDVPLEELNPDDETLSIVHEGDEYVVNGTLDLTAEGTLDDMASEEQELVAEFGETMEVRVAITFPGEVIEHNGELSERTVTWMPAFGETVDLRASAEDSPGSPLLWWIVAALGALLVIGLVVALALRRRPAAAPTAAPFPAPPAEQSPASPDEPPLAAPVSGVSADAPNVAADDTRPLDVDPWVTPASGEPSGPASRPPSPPYHSPGAGEQRPPA